MSTLAKDLNQPATAFLHPEGSDYHLRWFNASGELQFCGHATLASAHVLQQTGLRSLDAPICFHTPAGELHTWAEEEWLVLALPSQPPHQIASDPALSEALGANIVQLSRSPLDLLAELSSEEEVRLLAPKFQELAKIETRGVIVTAPSHHSNFDFVSRFFAPRLGIPEDAVTGTAHCCLGPYWSARLGKTDLTGRQLSARGGTVRVKTDKNRVQLLGKAVTVVQGTLPLLS